MSVVVSAAGQGRLMEAARKASLSQGFMLDAIAYGAIDAATRELLGVAVVQNRTLESAEVHFGMLEGRRISPALARALLGTVFEIHGPAVLLAPIAIDNVAIQIVGLKMGFRVSGLARGLGIGQDRVVLALTRETFDAQEARSLTEGARHGR